MVLRQPVLQTVGPPMEAEPVLARRPPLGEEAEVELQEKRGDNTLLMVEKMGGEMEAIPGDTGGAKFYSKMKEVKEETPFQEEEIPPEPPGSNPEGTPALLRYLTNTISVSRCNVVIVNL